MTTTEHDAGLAGASTNRYITGPYAPVTEEVTAFDMPVEGALPEQLAGRYLRNGPNPIDDVDPATHHWFAGDGMVHGVRLLDGRAVWYRNRYVGSDHVAEVRGTDDIPGPNWSGSATGPNTHVAGFAGTTWATVEAGATPVELTYELETIGRNDFSGTLPGAFTAHAKLDPDTRELHAMAYAPAQWMDHVQYVVVAPDGRVRRTVDIPLGMTMLHDMSLTQRYAVVYDQPCTVDLDLAMAGRFPFRWDPDHGNRVGLLPREGEAGDITWIEVPNGYAFHPMNAYDDDDGSVVIDLCNYDRMFDADLLGPFGDGGAPRLERWTLDPARRSASIDVVDDRPNEFPRHRGDRTAKPYRYGYCAVPSPVDGVAWPTVKHDLRTGERWEFDHGPGRAAGEPVFVAREGGGAEDDGWLLTFVHDLGTGATDFVVMDAADMRRGDYVARVRLPQRVPLGFHGSWVSDRAVPPPV